MFARSRLLGVLLLAATLAPAQQATMDPAIEARIKQVEDGEFTSDGQALSKRMERYKVPGVSIAVINGGKIEWARGYGLRDSAEKRGVDPSTLFQASSISKSLSAVGVMHLVQNGTLRLDEDVNQTLSSWKVPENPFTAEQKVTLRRLLSHTAGTTVHGFGGYAEGEPIPTLIQILQGSKPANSKAVVVTITPGTSFGYSGGGYEITQQLIADVTHAPFPEFMRKNVLEPIGMKDSSYDQPLNPALAERAAAGHSEHGKPLKGKWHTYPEMAAAGLWTTPSDLCRFILEFQQAAHGKSELVITSESAKQMLTRQKDNYGLGLGLNGYGPTIWFAHEGANEGFRAVFIGFLETGQGAAIMTNGENGDYVYGQILKSLAHIYHWPWP